MNRYLDFFIKLNLINENEKNIFFESCEFTSKKNLNEKIKININFLKLIPPKNYFSLLKNIKKLDKSIEVIITFSKKEYSFSELIDYIIYFVSNSLLEDKLLLINILKRKKGKYDNSVLEILFLNKNEEFILQKNKNFITAFFKSSLICIIDSLSFNLDENEINLKLFRDQQEKSNIKESLFFKKNIPINLESNKNIYNNKIVKGEVEDISNLIAEQGTAIIIGEIFKIEKILIKNSSKIFKFYITDYTDSIMVKAFPKEKFLPMNFLESIHEKMWIKVKINLNIDKYESNDLTGMISSLQIIDIPKEHNRKDTYENKRVELINHTTMTSFEGMISIDSLLEHAKLFGYDYICITDKYNCQSFPEAYKKFKDSNINLIYGVQLEVLDDFIDIVYNPSNDDFKKTVFTVFDLETTGLFPYYDEIIEFGAIKYLNGKKIDSIQFFIDPEKPLSSKISSITNITDNHLKGQVKIKEALLKIIDFFKDTVLVAHNGIKFDLPFLNCKLEKFNLPLIKNTLIDTMQVSRVLNTEFYSHSLEFIAKKNWIDYDSEIAHRADFDANILAQVWSKFLDKLSQMNIHNSIDLNRNLQTDFLKIRNRGYLTNVYCKKQKDLNLFYKLISCSLTDNLYGGPKILNKNLFDYKDKFIITNSPTEGEIIFKSWSSTNEELKNAILKYDFILISPVSCFKHEIARENITKENIEDSIKRIIKISNELNKKVIASSDSYYLNKNDKDYFDVYVHAKSIGGKRHRFFKYNESNEIMPDLYFRTTNEIVEEFNFLNKKIVNEIIVENSRFFANLFQEKIIPIKNDLFSPKIEGAEKKLLDLVVRKTLEIFGDSPHEFITKRINFEMESISKNGFCVIYWFSHLLVKKSLDDGYIVGSRGSVGSSLVAWLINISEVNPLPSHYLCKNCKYFEFKDDYESGFDLENTKCPNCNFVMQGDGHKIPFETFMGFDGDKTPDIDLNFSALYQSKAHEFIREMFGKDKVFRAGTISTIAEKTAYGYVKSYFESINKFNLKNAEIKRIASKCQNVKRTTGQHPGGIIVIPQECDIYDFTPYNFPADDNSMDWYTTHFAFEHLHDSLLKFDILGHDNPTVLKMLSEQTNIKLEDIPNHDDDVMELFYSTKSLKLKYLDLNEIIKVGTNGIPEFGTNFVKEMLLITKPKRFSDLIRISGLSHGTQVWTNNARNLIEKNNIDISQVIACRDDIMTYLSKQGIDSLIAFKIMEDVRKGKGLKKEYKEIMQKYNFPNWYIESCEKISYLFPKAHATAYVIMAWKIAWFKIHYPLYFYSSYLSIRIDVFDIYTIVEGKNGLLKKLKEINQKLSNPTTKLLVKKKEIDLIPIYEIVLEMIARGYSIKNIDLDKSDMKEFIIEDNYLIPPFSVIDSLGEVVAKSIVDARNKKPFVSKEDLLNRTKLTKTHFKILTELNVINHLDDDDQLILF